MPLPFEIGMIVCFGLSWPSNLMKSWKSRTARGKSIPFELMVLLGYVFGITGKFVNDQVNYVVFFYCLNFVMIAADILLTARNKALDRKADKLREKAAQLSGKDAAAQ